MKIVEQSGLRLVLEDRPWFIGILAIVLVITFLAGSLTLLAAGEVLGGLMMALVGAGVPLLLAALIVRRVRLTLDRTTGLITRTSRSFRGLSETVFDLSRLSGARLAASTDSDGTTYRMELALTDPPETVPFTSYYSGGAGPGRMCDAVTRWQGGDA